MKFLITENMFNKVIENYINSELNQLKSWIFSLDNFYDVYGEYDPSYIRAIEYTEKFDVIDTYNDDEDGLFIVVTIYSKVGDFDWDLLIYELEEKIKTMFKKHYVGIKVSKCKRPWENGD